MRGHLPFSHAELADFRKQTRAFHSIAAIVVGAAALASWLPTRRASRVAPVNALRAE